MAKRNPAGMQVAMLEERAEIPAELCGFLGIDGK